MSDTRDNKTSGSAEPTAHLCGTLSSWNPGKVLCKTIAQLFPRVRPFGRRGLRASRAAGIDLAPGREQTAEGDTERTLSLGDSPSSYRCYKQTRAFHVGTGY